MSRLAPIEVWRFGEAPTVYRDFCPEHLEAAWLFRIPGHMRDAVERDIDAALGWFDAIAWDTTWRHRTNDGCLLVLVGRAKPAT